MKNSNSKTDEQSDNAFLHKVLRSGEAINELEDLTGMARRSAASYNDGDCYSALTTAFCDGLEVEIDGVCKEVASATKSAMWNSIQSRLQEITVKNLLITTRRGKTYFWITFNPETARITCRTMTEMTKVLLAVKSHGESFWGFDDEKANKIKITKVDIAADLKGAFISNLSSPSY